MSDQRTIPIHEHYRRELELQKEVQAWRRQAEDNRQWALREEMHNTRLRETFVRPLTQGLLNRLLHAITIRSIAKREVR